MSPEIEHLTSLQHTYREIQRLKNEIAELPKRVAAIEQRLAGTKAGLQSETPRGERWTPTCCGTTIGYRNFADLESQKFAIRSVPAVLWCCGRKRTMKCSQAS